MANTRKREPGRAAPGINADSLRRRIDALQDEFGRPGRVVVAFSGGRDSTLLTFLMSRLAGELGFELVAAHINHGLQPEADAWQRHCRAQAQEYGVRFAARAVQVDRADGGAQAAARKARYAALAAFIGRGDWLLTGHHQEDQAETLLLHLMRGSGIGGLRGIARCRPFGAGLLLRPLLDTPAADIEAGARHHGLSWIEDPSNRDTRHDRNFLRARIFPVLGERWPAAARQLAQSAERAATAAELLDVLGDIDLEHCGGARRLELAPLSALSTARQQNVIRRACRRGGLPPPPARQLAALLEELLPARADAAPLVAWTGAEARRYRGHLYLEPPLGQKPEPPAVLLTPARSVALGAGCGELGLQPDARGGLRPASVAPGLAIRYRQGGERIRPQGRMRHHRLKNLLQEAGIVPWMRDRIPLLYAGEELVAVADLWFAAEHFEAGGLAVCWRHRPPVD